MALLAAETGASRTTLEAALQASGFHYLPAAELTRIVDDAAREVILEELWPWRIAEDAGAAPLTVELLGQVDSVRRTSDDRPLYPRRHSELVERHEGGLDSQGNPTRYYLEGPGKVCVHPESTESITVRHFSRTVWNTGGERSASAADTVNLPRRWDDVLLAFARERAHLFNGDMEQAGVHRGWAEQQMVRMREQELAQFDEPDVIRCTESY